MHGFIAFWEDAREVFQLRSLQEHLTFKLEVWLCFLLFSRSSATKLPISQIVHIAMYSPNKISSGIGSEIKVSDWRHIISRMRILTALVYSKGAGGIFVPLVMIFAVTNMTGPLVKRSSSLAHSIGALSRAGYRPVFGSRIFCRKLYLPTVSQMSLPLTVVTAIQEHNKRPNWLEKVT
jgi:hypothetical protein